MAVYRIRGAPRAPPRQGPRQLHRANARPRWLGQLARLGEPRRAAAGYPPPGPEPRCPAPVRGLRKLPDSGHPPLACPRARGPPQSRTPVWVLPDCFQNSFAPLTLFTIHTSTIQTPSSAKCNSWKGTSAVTSGQWPITSKLNETAANHRSIIAHCSLFIVHCSLFIVHWPLAIGHFTYRIASMKVTLLISFKVVRPSRTLSSADSRRNRIPSSRAARRISEVGFLARIISRIRSLKSSNS